MYHFYNRKVVLYLDGKAVEKGYLSDCISKNPHETKTFSLSWDNFRRFDAEMFAFNCSFIRRRKGFIFYSLDRSFKKRKQWKNKELNAIIEIKYNEFQPSMEEAMKLMTASAFAEYVHEILT